MASKALAQLGMTAPNRDIHDLFNKELEREQQYDRAELNAFVQNNEPRLNINQRTVYDQILRAIEEQHGGVFFLDAAGSTRKTFVISIILATIRAQGRIALALASSGIAATLLDGGRTAHSALKLPLNMKADDNPTCNISKRSAMARVLQQCSLIVWDECTMANKKSLEALNRTLKDIRGDNRLFGGALILLAGDFRQTLPVVKLGTSADEINACLKTSNLWRSVKTLRLTTNVRVQLQKDASADLFSRQLLNIGNSILPVDNSGFITLPNNFCTFVSSKEYLIQSMFPNIVQNYRHCDWLRERAILAGANKDVNEINASILNSIPGEMVAYRSIDTIINQDDNFMPTFKIQGQIYHRAGSLLPFDNADHQFLQLYFIGNAEDEADRRCAIITNTRRQIIFDLQNMFQLSIKMML
ncbi:ATP-dependent DNA helicase pif1-like [Drosophila obscura]|uniref:ATP-dependent DNA helicase pif1-like n=1 Tax=Drosophila obscura TaxID=7282 RepID=UPI001BB13D59|nr:ATP-dependent DNA helicase pif1-like [Drosophila obscura]